MEKYIYLSPKIIIKSYINTTFRISYLVLEETENRKYSKNEKIYRINEIGKEILMLLDGESTYDQIITSLSQKYEETKLEVDHKVSGFIRQLNKFGYSLCEQDFAKKHSIQYYEFENYYPTVASLELTNTCNLRCRHCYGDYGEKKYTGVMSFEDIKKVITSLSEIGLSILELTGGDPTMNPNCADAIEYAIESGIGTVMLLTNGVYITDKLLNTLKKYKKNLYIQVDLHSLDENYYDWFTKSKGNLKTVKKNIDMLIANDIRVRICAIFTPGNLKEVCEIGEYAHTQGAVQYAPSVVTNIGRAVTKESLLFHDMDQLYKYKNMQNSLALKYPGFVQNVVEIEGMTRKNCGAIRSEVSIDTFGNIKLCNMDSGEDFKLNMGNVLQNSVKEIFDQNKVFLNALADVGLPNLSQEGCSACNERAFCHGCLLRGFLAARRLHKNNEVCNWYFTLPEAVKERFPLN